jgi:hypothetical protein
MLDFAVKTGRIETGRVVRVVKPIATVRIQVEPDTELTREFGTDVNTIG